MAQIAVSEIVNASTVLMRAGRWEGAAQLLHVTQTDTADERLRVAAAIAEVTVDQDSAQHVETAGPALLAAEEALSQAPDATIHWDLEMLRFRKDYGTALFNQTSGDSTTAVELAERAERLRSIAPTEARAGAVTFYAGVVADNLQGLAPTAFNHYTEALEIGERVGDDLLISLALRHLGDHAHIAGDLELARAQWERSTELRQKIGHLLGALAQQALLAVLARDEGDQAASVALATEVNRWSTQAHLPWLASQSADLMKQTVS